MNDLPNSFNVNQTLSKHKQNIEMKNLKENKSEEEQNVEQKVDQKVEQKVEQKVDQKVEQKVEQKIPDVNKEELTNKPDITPTPEPTPEPTTAQAKDKKKNLMPIPLPLEIDNEDDSIMEIPNKDKNAVRAQDLLRDMSVDTVKELPKRKRRGRKKKETKRSLNS